MTNNIKHISYSALKTFTDCNYKYKLSYIDGVRGFEGNEYTIFGTALHEACELKVQNDSENEKLIFENKFKEEYDKLPVKNPDISYDTFLEQGKKLAPLIIPALKEYFGDFEFVSAEEELYTPIDDTNFNFKGFIDLVIKTKDGRYCILDYKTTSWGWDAKKKSDTMTNYQLAYYKHFFAKIKGIDPKEIDTFFVLLKRTAKKDSVEVVPSKIGTIKIKNSLKVLNNCVTTIERNVFFKNRLACQFCPYYKKECT
jgi:predicted RecB family nuclease